MEKGDFARSYVFLPENHIFHGLARAPVAPRQLFSSPSGSERAVFGPFSRPSGSEAAVFEAQWLRGGRFRGPVAPKGARWRREGPQGEPGDEKSSKKVFQANALNSQKLMQI